MTVWVALVRLGEILLRSISLLIRHRCGVAKGIEFGTSFSTLLAGFFVLSADVWSQCHFQVVDDDEIQG